MSGVRFNTQHPRVALPLGLGPSIGKKYHTLTLCLEREGERGRERGREGEEIVHMRALARAHTHRQREGERVCV
jgi:hypothetical protein